MGLLTGFGVLGGAASEIAKLPHITLPVVEAGIAHCKRERLGAGMLVKMLRSEADCAGLANKAEDERRAIEQVRESFARVRARAQEADAKVAREDLIATPENQQALIVETLARIAADAGKPELAPTDWDSVIFDKRLHIRALAVAREITRAGWRKESIDAVTLAERTARKRGAA